MNIRDRRHRGGFQSLEICGIVIFLLTVGAFAQQHKTFAEEPSKRTFQALEARTRAEQEKSTARQWAQRRGLEMRYDDGTRTTELLAIRKGRPLFFTTMNDIAAISTTADAVRNSAPYNAAGSGVSVGIWDGGMVMTNHQEFGPRIVAEDVTSAHYHATHVAGTIAASGVQVRAKGMAPEAQIISYDWNSNDSEMISSAAAAPGETNQLYLSNHSYGILCGWIYAHWTNPWTRRSGYHWWGDLATDTAEAYFGQYGYGPREWDEIAYDAPYFLIFKAAGNERDDNPQDGATVYYTPDDGETWTNTVFDSAVHPLGDGQAKSGYDSIPYYGNAKNIMTVGAVHDATNATGRSLLSATNTIFGSWGPADDGRIKPDIVANGHQLYSSFTSASNSYASRSGTSMSCPNATGSAALLIDYYDDLFPGDAMRASTLKGLILHTADDLGRPGPDYQYGWGLMNTQVAADLLKKYAEGNLIQLIEDSLSDTTVSNVWNCFVDGGAPLRVTLCWTDPPGSYSDELDDRAPALVNDLDLKVVGPHGTYYPFRLSYENPEAPAVADGKNYVDNVEQVLIHFPTPGNYTIVVEHDGALQGGAQHFSLLTSGAVSDQDEDGLPDYWETGFFSSLTGSVASADADGDGLSNIEEYISGSDPTDPFSRFSISSVESIYATNESPFVIHWDALPGRVYNVNWTYNLRYVPFQNISGELPWPVSSYTDTVDRIGNGSLYRIDVRMVD